MNNQTTFIPDCQAQQAIKFCRYLIAKLDNSKLFLPKLLLGLLHSPPLRHQLKFTFSEIPIMLPFLTEIPIMLPF